MFKRINFKIEMFCFRDVKNLRHRSVDWIFHLKAFALYFHVRLLVLCIKYFLVWMTFGDFEITRRVQIIVVLWIVELGLILRIQAGKTWPKIVQTLLSVKFIRRAKHVYGSLLVSNLTHINLVTFRYCHLWLMLFNLFLYLLTTN